MDLQKEIDSLKVKSGYSGKPQQWQYGFDLACRELAKAQAIPDGFVVVPEEPTERMLDSAYSSISDNLHCADLENIYTAMIRACDE